jgi:tetratricopeptide (TPR) repeat protein
MKKSIFILTILFSNQLTFCQASDSLIQKFSDLVIRSVKAENDRLFDKAIILIDSAIAIDSTRDFTYTIKSEILWMSKRYAEATETYKKSMSVKTPDFLISAYVLLGMLYDKANMRKEAKTHYSYAIKKYESGYTPPQFDKTEEIEYVFAFGLLGDKKNWVKKLRGIIKKYPSQNYQILEKKTRQELLEFHFSPYGG